MKFVCEKDMCTGCMACVDNCNKKAITIKDSLSSYNAVIDENLCVECGACFKVCQQNNPVQGFKPKTWYQGWSSDENIRKNAASGGVVTTIAKDFIISGGYVAACVFKDGNFIYDIIDNEEEIKKISGSKYVKSSPNDIYSKSKSILKNGNKLLFIGLPCHVAALKNFVNDCDNLYTIDIVCHGTPSPKLLDKFLDQYNISISNTKNISFRTKTKYAVVNDSKYVYAKGVCDNYSLAFVKSLTCTESCYTCNYAKTERISDITVGDSWGSDLPPKEQMNGISLLLVQNDKGKSLVQKSNLTLFDVDLNKAVDSNNQLKRPSSKPKLREKFFEKIDQNCDFNKSVVACLPWSSFKQQIKRMLSVLFR